jgi:hypothetical protein
MSWLSGAIEQGKDTAAQREANRLAYEQEKPTPERTTEFIKPYADILAPVIADLEAAGCKVSHQEGMVDIGEPDVLSNFKRENYTIAKTRSYNYAEYYDAYVYQAFGHSWHIKHPDINGDALLVVLATADPKDFTTHHAGAEYGLIYWEPNYNLFKKLTSLPAGEISPEAAKEVVEVIQERLKKWAAEHAKKPKNG